MKTCLPLALSLIMYAGIAPAGQIHATKLGENITLTGGTYSDGGGISVAAEFRHIDGQLALCGAWSESRKLTSRTRHKAVGLLAAGSVWLGGQPILKDLSFMRQVSPRQDYAGADARCVKTSQPWRGAVGAPTIRIPRQTVHVETGNNGGARQTVTFRQNGPGALSNALDPVAILKRIFGATPDGT